MKVFVLLCRMADEPSILEGVFSSREKAENKIKELEDEVTRRWWSYEIIEEDLQ